MESSVPKYRQPIPVDISDRQWPSRTITKAPQWCSVDLRDGNQALPNPLGPKEKLEFFKLLCEIGFKQIEVAFPSGSRDDFDFTREVIEGGYVPDETFIMVLSQCRPELIKTTMEALRGAKKAIAHLYLATSELHMRQVLGRTRKEMIEMAVRSVRQVRELARAMAGSDVRLEFSPEEFTDTEPGFAMEICQAVYQAWGQATEEKRLILNLPHTVERRPPNQYADMIECFCRNWPEREKIVVSVHAHNDQGMAVASTEMALMAGADRVEGTLFGHGDRAGNTDLVIVAGNLHSRGIETGLDLSDLPKIGRTVERLTGIPIYCRQPYAGEYVFTAFSGSHQDAIRKGMHKLGEAAENFGVRWKVPYLHVDPSDLGRSYERLIRITSQSGKGGVAWVLEQEYGLSIPKAMQPEVGLAVQRFSDEMRREISAQQVYRILEDEFVNPEGPYELLAYWPRPDERNPTWVHGEVRVKLNGEERSVAAEGNGPISAFVNCMRKVVDFPFNVEDYHEQAMGKGADAKAVAYVPLELEGKEVVFGVGMDTNIDQAAVRAIVAGLNRIAARRTWRA